jgi:hypothetical protein
LLLGGFAALFGLGLFSIWRRPVTAGAAGGDAAAPGAGLPRGRKRAERQSRADDNIVSVPVPKAERRQESLPSPAVVAGATRTATATPTVSDVEREVEQGLDGLKDKLFLLELRRQAGTISEEDYLRERTQAEKILRELVGR